MTKVLVGFPSGGHPHPSFTTSLSALVYYELQNPTPMYHLAGPPRTATGCYVASNRNRIAKHALEIGADWVLQLDDDIEFQPDLLRSLMGDADPEKRPIIFGFYLNVAKESDSGFLVTPMLHSWISEKKKFSTLENVDLFSVFEIDGAGTGCSLVHRGVYERMIEMSDDEWSCYRTRAPFGGSEFGEDLLFCYEAKQIHGFPIWASTKSPLRHWKQRPVELYGVWRWPAGRSL